VVFHLTRKYAPSVAVQQPPASVHVIACAQLTSSRQVSNNMKIEDLGFI